MSKMSALEDALADYQNAVSQPWDGTSPPYSEFETKKLAIANWILSALGLPTGPKEPVCFGGPTTTPALSLSPQNPQRPGFVYLMRNTRNNFIKIGWSINPKYREHTLQSQEPEIELIAFWNGTRKTEAVLHLMFASKRIRGEWFSLDYNDLSTIKSLFA